MVDEGFNPTRFTQVAQGKSANPTTMKDENGIENELKAITTIHLCSAEEVVYHMQDSITKLREKLENLYIAFFLLNSGF